MDTTLDPEEFESRHEIREGPNPSRSDSRYSMPSIHHQVAVLMLGHLLALSTVGPIAAQDAEPIQAPWVVDPLHSRIGFTVRYMGIGSAEGRFQGFNGSVFYDPEKIFQTTVTIFIDTESIDTGTEMRDDDLRSSNWFDADTYPTIRFQSEAVSPTSEGFDVVGSLTIKDVTKRITLHFDEPTPIIRDVQGIDRVGFSGVIKLKRKEYNVQGWGSYNRILDIGGMGVSNDVSISLNLQAKRSPAEYYHRVVHREGREWLTEIFERIRSGDTDGGLRLFDAAQKRNQDGLHSGSLYNVGKLLTRLGLHREAVDVITYNSVVFPDWKGSNTIGEIFAAMGDRPNAIKYFEMALEARGGSYANAIEYLRRFGGESLRGANGVTVGNISDPVVGEVAK